MFTLSITFKENPHRSQMASVHDKNIIKLLKIIYDTCRSKTNKYTYRFTTSIHSSCIIRCFIGEQ